MRSALPGATPLTLALLLACSGAPEDGSRQDAAEQFDWSPYIAAHTPERISRRDPIRVRFTTDQVTEEQVGEEAPPRLSFEPAIEGVATWSSRRELTFHPAAPLTSGASYRVLLSFEGLAERPDHPARFAFSIRVIPQHFELTIEGLSADPTAPSLRILEGALITADVEDAAPIERVLRAVYRGEERPLRWSHGKDGKTHRFSIPGLARPPEEAALTLHWDGEAIGLDLRGTREIAIPPLDRFEVTRVRAIQDDGQYVLIRFSDVLDPAQPLEGLVQIGGALQRAVIEDNLLRVYPRESLQGRVAVRIDAGLRNRAGEQLGAVVTRAVVFPSLKPALRFVGSGVIVPHGDKVRIPFEAVAVHSLQVTAFRVYEDNVGQFLQSNPLDGTRGLKYVGRYLWRKTLHLDPVEAGKWTRYDLDASELWRAQPGGLLHLELSINRGNVSYACPEAAGEVPPVPEDPYQNYDDQRTVDRSGWDGWSGPPDRSRQGDRKDPCQDAYYRFASEARTHRNFLASNLGLLAKRGDDTDLFFTTTDLRTALPLAGVAIEVRNFQHQILATATSDDSGWATAQVAATPFYAVARHDDEVGYLRLNTGSALATSHLDVGGEKVERGVKGVFYGERDIWRPGDVIHLVFALHDEEGKLPPGHPVTVSLFDPRGREVLTRTQSAPVGDFYAFHLKTDEDAPTGRWRVRAQLGGLRFERRVRIETIAPNRLAVKLDFGADVLRAAEQPLRGELSATWLHGAVAAGLKAHVDARLRPRPTRFSRAVNYVFDDPTRSLGSEEEPLFEGRLDDAGRVHFSGQLPVHRGAPGILTARFRSRVFERGGAFSSEYIELPFHPYPHYVGVKLPPGDRARGMLRTDEAHTVEIATLDSRGEPVSLRGLEAHLYKVKWRWWWDQSPESLARYATASHHGAVARGRINTVDGVGKWQFELNYPQWGRYLLRVCDPGGGHCTGKVIYIDWPGWAGRGREQSGVGATALSMSADKSDYTVGERAVIRLPAAHRGRALVSVETGSRLLSQRWVEVAEGENQLEIPIGSEMAPTAYVNAVLLQPHTGKQSDRPIRLYGYLPLHVEDPGTRLQPVLEAPERVGSKQPFALRVSEGQGRPMTYTLAVVDEGLLGLTRFATPDLHSVFYRREALGIRTWDVFDLVVGAYGGALERLLALGGDESAPPPADSEKRRFPPVVRFLGPFALGAGETASHRIELPEYFGAVRAMVVAGDGRAYGSTHQSIAVRDSLMLLATLPRVLGPEEALRLPVEVFATDTTVGRVEITLQTDDFFQTVGPAVTHLEFAEPGDQLAFFQLRSGRELGRGTVTVLARSDGGAEARQQIHLEIRAPNPVTIRQERTTLASGESHETKLVPHGLPGTNRVAIEVSGVPPMDLERRLSFLIRYPHGCIEQTTSAVFPQLFLPNLVSLEPAQREELEGNVRAGIRRLGGFQLPSGGFSYWPGGGGGGAHVWATSYAGHFLIEAAERGHHVSASLRENWLAYQSNTARSWTAGLGLPAQGQAYRLYTLALAGEPAVGAMNRLRERGGLSAPARWLLAAAYQRAGQRRAAAELVGSGGRDVQHYDTTDRTFGSALRDRAIELLTLVELGRAADAEPLMRELSAALSGKDWHSTQTTAFALLALSRYFGDTPLASDFSFVLHRGEGEAAELRPKTPIYRSELPDFPAGGQEVALHNTGERTLYATFSTTGIPPAGEESPTAQDLWLELRYTDSSGAALDVGQLAPGTDLVAEVVVVNTTRRKFENIALTHVFPSGWEILNPRLLGDSEEPDHFDYQDVRDDRVLTYFGLKPEQRVHLRLLLNASYTGRYYAPAVNAEAMYDASVHARSPGRWVTVGDAPTE